ncbi:AraC family transcriptional regulator [Marinobacter bohaiensis]|uniref:AraC family transcriptional regulator n=1 Tax=Marinobacter bohaiensis TaxID=2201898 RepID=UPI000DAE350E|nr:AraC family transcriptional regulator [Marinobacter bohaiensis]
MTTSLLQIVHSYTRKHADGTGIAMTSVPGLHLVEGTSPTELEHAIVKPLLCLVLQGAKRVSIGGRDHAFTAGDSMIVTTSAPTVSRISEATIAKPYLAVALVLEPTVIADLNRVIATTTTRSKNSGESPDADLEQAVFRLVKLLDRPDSLAVLQHQLVREIHYWLLMGKHGRAIGELGLPDGQVRRIGRAIALLHRAYADHLSIDQLAAEAGMGRSAFHRHFRAVTSVTPLQFQKQLRLIEARRQMLEKGKTASRAAFDVGYQSVSQFSREYARMFGRPPVSDRNAASRERVGSAGTTDYFETTDY